jgi:hypothetical protein
MNPYFNKEGYEYSSFDISKKRKRTNSKSSSNSRPLKRVRIQHSKTENFISTFMNLNIHDIEYTPVEIKSWLQTPNKNPKTNTDLQINFFNGTTDYGEIYNQAFEIYWVEYWKKYLTKNNKIDSKAIKYIIKCTKKKLPSVHCFKINEYELDYLFYYNISKRLTADKLCLNLQLYSLYDQMNRDKNVDNIVEDFNTPFNNNIFIKYISNNVKSFIEKYTRNIINEIYNLTESKTIISPSKRLSVIANTNTFYSILEINSSLKLKINKQIWNILETSFSENKSNNEHSHVKKIEFYKIKSHCIGDMRLFLLDCAEDIIEIGEKTEMDGYVQKITKLRDPYEEEEPIKPFLLLPPKIPPLPDYNTILSNFESHESSEAKKQYELKKKIYDKAVTDNKLFPKKEAEYHKKLQEYNERKEVYDNKMKEIENMKIPPLTDGEKTIIPQNYDKKRHEILEDLIGEKVSEVEICKLGDNGELISPFSTNFEPITMYPLYKLQTIVKIHSKDDTNKVIRTDCGNAIDLYNYVIDYYNEGKRPKHPIFDQELTDENIDAIMEKIPFAAQNLNVTKPKLNMVNNNKLFLYFHLSTYDQKDIDSKYQLDYYYVYLMRNFGGKKDENGNVIEGGYNVIVHYLCCFPAFITNNNGDVSIEETSYGMIENFSKLFENKRLLYNYNPPYCKVEQNENGLTFSTIAINAKILRMKSIFYWIKDSKKKKLREPKEIKDLFSEYYRNLEEF